MLTETRDGPGSFYIGSLPPLKHGPNSFYISVFFFSFLTLRTGTHVLSYTPISLINRAIANDDLRDLGSFVHLVLMDFKVPNGKPQMRIVGNAYVICEIVDTSMLQKIIIKKIKMLWQ